MDVRAEHNTRLKYYLAVISAVVVCFFGTVGIINYEHSLKLVKRGTRNDLAHIASLKVNQIERWRQEREGDAKVISKSPSLINQISKFVINPDSVRLRQDIFYWMRAVRDSYGYDDVILLDLSGRAILAAEDEKHMISPTTKELALRALIDRKIIVSDIYQNKPDGKRAISILTPLIDNRHNARGIIVLRSAPSDLIDEVVRPWSATSKSAEILLVGRNSDGIILLNEPLLKTENTRTPESGKVDLRFLQDTISRGYEGPIEGIDYRGVKVFAAVKAVPGWNWYVVAKIDKEEVFGDLDREFVLLVLSVGALAVAAATLFGYIWHRQQARMYHRQYSLELEKLALAKHYEYLTKYANDMIVLFDESGKIIEANERAIAAYGHTAEELLMMNMREFSAAGEKSGIEVHLKDAAVYDGTVFETIHQRKDGSTFPVEVSARIIEIDTRKFFQYIIRDITRRKHAEEEREKLIHDLEEALSKVEQLSGLLPICASCKKIRSDQGGWTQIESYIRDHSKADFTHSICPECAKKLYPDFYGDVWKKED